MKGQLLAVDEMSGMNVLESQKNLGCVEFDSD